MSYDEFCEKLIKAFRRSHVIGTFDYDEENGLYIAYTTDGTKITGNPLSDQFCFTKKNGFKAVARL